MSPNQTKKVDVPYNKSDVRPEVDASVVTASEGKKSDWAAVDDAAERARQVEAESQPDGKIEVVVTSQVMLPETKGADGVVLTGGRIAKRGERIRVSREFLKKHRGHYVETVDEFERQERKARGEDDF
jgi:predicted house-cleaning NTP pyrophosphatase (Maf/HAM1 superfamily)